MAEGGRRDAAAGLGRPHANVPRQDGTGWTVSCLGDDRHEGIGRRRRTPRDVKLLGVYGRMSEAMIVQSALSGARLAPPPAESRTLERELHQASRILATLEALPEAHYASALEVGPTPAGLTRRLAARCARLTVADDASRPVLEMRRRATTLPHVAVRRMSEPYDLPRGPFDLLVIADHLNPLDERAITRLALRAVEVLAEGGHCVLAHWLKDGRGLKEGRGRLIGDLKAGIFVGAAGEALQPVLRRRTPHYRLDVLERVGA